MNNPKPISTHSEALRPKGPRLILANAHLLAEEGKAKIQAGASNLTVDLAEIEFIDSSGIGALVGLRKRIGEGQVALVNVGGFVATVLNKTKTAPLFDFDGS